MDMILEARFLSKSAKKENVLYMWASLVFYSCFWDPQEISEKKHFPFSLLLMVRKLNIWESKKAGFLPFFFFLLKYEHNSSLQVKLWAVE